MYYWKNEWMLILRNTFLKNIFIIINNEDKGKTKTGSFTQVGFDTNHLWLWVFAFVEKHTFW